MKDILFRAKRIDNGKWVEGYYAYSGIVDRNYIITVRGTCALPPYHWMFDNIEIDKNTLCQYTGLTDKNGNRIWENDIVNCFEAECCGKISWNESEAGFYFDVLLEDGTYEEEHIYDYADCMDVIGNIFDNPELNQLNQTLEEVL